IGVETGPFFFSMPAAPCTAAVSGRRERRFMSASLPSRVIAMASGSKPTVPRRRVRGRFRAESRFQSLLLRAFFGGLSVTIFPWNFCLTIEASGRRVGQEENKGEIKSLCKREGETFVAEFTREAGARQTCRDRRCPAIHPVERDCAGRSEPAAAAAIRRRTGNHAGPGAAEKRMHRPRAQPSQRAAYVRSGRCVEVLDR